jgi:hypothetical protein
MDCEAIKIFAICCYFLGFAILMRAYFITRRTRKHYEEMIGEWKE